MIRAILSVSPDWGIADREGNLLYRSPEDLKLFRGLTWGHPVVAGRRTAETLPGGLKGRDCLCLGSVTPEGWQFIEASKIPDGSWVIGGANTLERLMPLIDEVWISFFKADPLRQSVISIRNIVGELHSLNSVDVAEFEDFNVRRFMRHNLSQTSASSH